MRQCCARSCCRRRSWWRIYSTVSAPCFWRRRTGTGSSRVRASSSWTSCSGRRRASGQCWYHAGLCSNVMIFLETDRGPAITRKGFFLHQGEKEKLTANIKSMRCGKAIRVCAEQVWLWGWGGLLDAFFSGWSWLLFAQSLLAGFQIFYIYLENICKEGFRDHSRYRTCQLESLLNMRVPVCLSFR